MARKPLSLHLSLDDENDENDQSSQQQVDKDLPPMGHSSVSPSSRANTSTGSNTSRRMKSQRFANLHLSAAEDSIPSSHSINSQQQSIEILNHNVTLKKRNDVTQSMDYAVTGSGTFKKGIFSINRKWKDLQLEDLEQTTMLGQGSSGVVYLARHKHKNLPLIAVKNISAFDKEKRNQILKELAALSDSSSPYLVGFYGAFYDEGSISMALEYMEGGSLKDIVDGIADVNSSQVNSLNKQALPESILSKVTEQVLLGLQYLHKERHMVHRDVKPSNILMNRHGIFKLTDFGVSAQLENTLAACKTFVGTVTYMSPERLQGNVYSYASDVWSLGITVYECISGQFPFQKEDGSKPVSGFWELLTYIKKSHPHLAVEDGYSEEVSDFVAQCLQKNPEDRPTVSELLNHPFITKYRDQGAKQYEHWYKDVLQMIQNRQKASKSITKEENSDMIQKRIQQLNL